MAGCSKMMLLDADGVNTGIGTAHEQLMGLPLYVEMTRGLEKGRRRLSFPAGRGFAAVDFVAVPH